MRRLTRGWGRRAAAWAAGACVCAAAEGEPLSATGLVTRITEARPAGGFRLRASLMLEDPARSGREVRQVRILGRRDGDTLKLLYQCLWPRAMKGEALFIAREPDGAIRGFHYRPPDRVEPVSAGSRGMPLLGSGLTVEDLVEEFWTWPVTELPGETNLLGHACRLIEFRAPAASGALCPRVRAWVAPDVLLPLYTVKLDAGGAPVKWFTVRRLAKAGREGWAPVSVEIRACHTAVVTTLTGHRGARDVVVPEERFTVDAVRRAPDEAADESDAGDAATEGDVGDP